MAEPFSYFNDIAPMQQRFFGSVAGSRDISAAQKNRLIGASIGNQLKFDEALTKLQDSQLERRTRDLQFEEANLRLRKAKEDMDRQKDILREMPLLERELEDIKNDPDEESQTRRLSIFGIRNASKISNVPEVDQAFRAASFGVNRGSQARPSITYGDLVMKGVPPEMMGLTDEVDINSAVPSTTAAKAIRYIADEKTKIEQSEKAQEIAEERQGKIDEIYGDTASFLQKADINTPVEAFEFAGSRIMPFVAPEKQKEFNALITSRKAITNSKDPKKEEALKSINDKLRSTVQDIVLSYDPTRPLSSTPTLSPTAAATRNRFVTPTTK